MEYQYLRESVPTWHVSLHRMFLMGKPHLIRLCPLITRCPWRQVALYLFISSMNRLTAFPTRQSEMANTSPRQMPVLGNAHPIKIENFDFFLRDVIYLLARVFILLIDTATQEVPLKNIWKKLSVQFLRYAIQLLHVKRRTRHKWC